MARGGFRIFDSDTHVGPDARILAGYLSEAEKDRLRGWEAYKSQDRSGHETYTKGQRRYRRRCQTARNRDPGSAWKRDPLTGIGTGCTTSEQEASRAARAVPSRATERRPPWDGPAKRPFGDPEQVLAYLGRYTHRVAIANSRLAAVDDPQVGFRLEGLSSSLQNEVDDACV